MKKRITMITLLDVDEMNKINDLIKNIKEQICKVPYGIDDENRYKIDNLPFHFTIFATDKQNESKMIELMEQIKCNSVKVKVNQVKIMKGSKDSFVLYLSIEENENIKHLQNIFYKELHSRHYNPDDFNFHMTLHIDTNYERILLMQKIINNNFKPFIIEFNRLGFFNYPGEIIKEINFTK